MSRPEWIRGKLSWNENTKEIKELLNKLRLNTVCVEAACPNRGECWEGKEATFMILGSSCTRGCLFCNVDGEEPSAPEEDEPERIAKAVEELGVEYAVITSVTRDDLPDKGVGEFLRTIEEVKKVNAHTIVEILIPDFGGERNFIQKVASSGAEVIGHNIEVPERMYPAVRPKSDYLRSLEVLRTLSDFRNSGANILVKSSLIIGFGEEEEDIENTFKDLDEAGVDIVYIGQYLSPSKNHWPVKRFYTPEEFEKIEKQAKAKGFKAVKAAPLVRSSYKAFEAYSECIASLGRA